MRRECRELFLRHWLQRQPPASAPGVHHGTCVMRVPWFMSGSLTCGGGENSGTSLKRSRHSRRMRNPQFYVSGERPMAHTPFSNSIYVRLWHGQVHPIIYVGFEYSSELNIQRRLNSIAVEAGAWMSNYRHGKGMGFIWLALLPRVRGFWSWFGGVCSLTYCNVNFRVTVVSEPFNVIL